MKQPIISIQLASNRPQQLDEFFSCLQQTTHDYSAIEVIINLDVDDTEISKFLDQQKAQRPFSIQYIKTFSGGFYNFWKPINDMLPYTHPNAYFIIFLSDEILFCTPGWDDIVKRYINYYPDNIFRLRASQFRYRHYADYWECGFAPDSIVFATRHWVEIIHDWGPCFSPDAFQQCVAYYLSKSEPFSKEHYLRDIPVPDLQFKGEGASIGLTGKRAIERARGGLRAWFILVSFKIQTEAARRAMLLKANIVKAQRYKQQNHVTVVDQPNKKRICLIQMDTQQLLASFSYKLNRVAYTWKNQWRKLNYLYYAGGGRERKKLAGRLLYNLTYYLAFKHNSLKKLHDYYCHFITSLPGYYPTIKRKLRDNRDHSKEFLRRTLEHVKSQLRR